MRQPHRVICEAVDVSDVMKQESQASETRAFPADLGDMIRVASRPPDITERHGYKYDIGITGWRYHADARDQGGSEGVPDNR